jgi:clan AA aspartic protease (TIGR02281 family)
VTEFAHIAVLLIELYVALGVMAIGFGYMLAGRLGGSRVAGFYFGRSLRWVGARVRGLVTAVLALVKTLLVAGLVRPLLLGLQKSLRWLAGRRRRLIAALAVVVLLALTLVALAAPAAAQTVTLRAQGHGMFYADTLLDGRLRVRALIDTGATYLSMCGTTAAAFGLILGESVELRTANGVITSRRATVRSVRIGGIEVRNVAAVVDGRRQCDTRVLVGMSVLGKLSLRLDGETLVLSTKPTPASPIEWWLLGGLWGALVMSLAMVHRRRLRFPIRAWRRQHVPMAMPFKSRSLFE